MPVVSDSIRFDIIQNSRHGLQNSWGIVLLIGFLLFPSLVWADDGGDCIWWHFEGQQRMRDAGVEASFVLCGADAMKIDELEFFHTTDSIRPSPSENQRAMYRKTVPVDTRSLVLYGGRYERIELWAVARANGKTLVAQTAINLYGQSGFDRTDFEKMDGSHILPGFNMNQGSSSYRATTGTSVNFTMPGSPDATGPVRVLLDGEKIDELRPEAGVYSYVLPRDRKLTVLTRRDYRDLLFLADANDADTADGVRVSYYMPLYRSMRDNLDFTGGLAMLLASMVMGLGVVILKGRRFTWR